MALTESPFIHAFEFGGDKGYWTGNHMILQVEDCIDCLRVLFADQYDYTFLFDHSSGVKMYVLVHFRSGLVKMYFYTFGPSVRDQKYNTRINPFVTHPLF